MGWTLIRLADSISVPPNTFTSLLTASKAGRVKYLGTTTPIQCHLTRIIQHQTPSTTTLFTSKLPMVTRPRLKWLHRIQLFLTCWQSCWGGPTAPATSPPPSAAFLLPAVPAVMAAARVTLLASDWLLQLQPVL